MAFKNLKILGFHELAMRVKQNMTKIQKLKYKEKRSRLSL